ncbi:MAG: DUF4845 domain-containing protein [Gallionellaceae bacterium]|nr:DUF4845 domain-containing protein [Gallionellaceae bacterium]
MHGQRGFTLATLLFLLFLAGLAAMIAFKTVPTYIDHYVVQKSLENILAEGTNRTAYELRQTFEARLNVNSIYSIKASDLQISRDQGRLTLSVPISSKKPLVHGISISVDLVATASVPLQ